MKRLIYLFSVFFILCNLGVRSQSLLIGYGQADIKSYAPIPVVTMPNTSTFDGISSFNMEVNYPIKRSAFEVIGRYVNTRGGTGLIYATEGFNLFGAIDQKINRFDLGLLYSIKINNNRWNIKPYATMGLLNSFPKGRNDIDAWFRVVNPPLVNDINKWLVPHPGTYFSSSLGIRLGLNLGKSKKFSLNWDHYYLFSPHNIQSLYLEYYSSGAPQDTLLAISEGTCTGYNTVLSLGYHFQRLKNKKEKSASGIIKPEEMKLEEK